MDSVTISVDAIVRDIDNIPTATVSGEVVSVSGFMIECAGLESMMGVGARCRVIGRTGESVLCEVVGFRRALALLMPFADIQGIGIGCRVELDQASSSIYPHMSWLGRVINAFGEPIDGKGPLEYGERSYLYRSPPPPAHQRKRVGARIDLGVAAINCFMTCCRGQRMGIFAGSGVGKSVLMSMMARFSQHDVNVIGLIGERGREVQEFIEDYLGEEGLARSVVIVATSDESALMRKQAAHLTMAMSEFFRDQDKDVLCMMDSVTRFAMAMREIGLSAGEPPATKGYTPMVFSELPKLLERAGPGTGNSVVTGLFSVLVEGDDHNEPVADTVRGILDGHIVLERAIAERGRFPAINILRSISRTMPDCNPREQQALIMKAKQLMSTYEDMADMIRLGAYRRGSDPQVDEAIVYNPQFEKFLSQQKDVKIDMDDGFARLAQIMAPLMKNKEAK